MVRLVVLSDLHAHQQEIDAASAPSSLSMRPQHQDKAVNPVIAFPDVLADYDFSPQLIICPGDLGDKNDSIAQQYAWKRLDEVKRKTRANRLIGVVGNHDLDSRRENAFQLPNSNLKALEPTFPLSNKGKSDKYWSDGFVFYQFENACILLVNSCEFHGVSTKAGKEEHLNGKISKDSIEAIRKQIRTHCRDVNILIVHHHIRQHPWLPNENSHIENGPTLLNVLETSGHQWLVIHGHAHLPHISYASTAALSPVIFSAGSVAATLWNVPNRVPRNQAYAIEVVGAAGNGIRGQITAWDWAPYVGWSPAAVSSGLPHESGFGLRPDASAILSQMEEAFSRRGFNYLNWNEVQEQIDSLSYLIPEDRDAAFKALQARGITVHFDSGGNPTIFSRK